jgi:hypothetical protein
VAAKFKACIRVMEELVNGVSHRTFHVALLSFQYLRTIWTKNCLMFVPCIARRSINNQLYALNYITSLFNIQNPTCFGSGLSSSGSFLDPCELLEMQNK